MFKLKSLLHRDDKESLVSTITTKETLSSDKALKDFVLAGTTLKVYKLLVTRVNPVGPREVQRLLGLSSPTVASFHLEKLERVGLIAKKEYDGTYVVHKLHLKHFILLRRHLIPRYFLYASLSTAIIGGWVVIMSLAGLLETTVISFSRISVVYISLYGVMASITLCVIFWKEALRVLKNEEI